MIGYPFSRFVKSQNINGCSLDNSSQLVIGGTIKDYLDVVLRACSKIIGVGLSSKVEILVLLVDLL